MTECTHPTPTNYTELLDHQKEHFDIIEKRQEEIADRPGLSVLHGMNTLRQAMTHSESFAARSLGGDLAESISALLGGDVAEPDKVDTEILANIWDHVAVIAQQVGKVLRDSIADAPEPPAFESLNIGQD